MKHDPKQTPSLAAKIIQVQASWDVESSQTTDQIKVPCISRQILNPWTAGKILHAVEQLSPRATTTEPGCLEPVLCHCKSTREATAMRSPRTTARE